MAETERQPSIWASLGLFLASLVVLAVAGVLLERVWEPLGLLATGCSGLVGIWIARRHFTDRSR